VIALTVAKAQTNREGRMWIRTRPSSVSMFLEVRTSTEDQPTPLREIISFGLLPTDDHDHLDLETGEVFQDYSYARLRKNEKKLIAASAAIQIIPDVSSGKHNAMRYIKERTATIVTSHLRSILNYSSHRQPSASLRRT
jgi:hypothetical protein